MRITDLRVVALCGVISVSLLGGCDPFRQDLLPSDKRIVENPDATNYFITPHSAAAIDLKTLLSFSASNLTLRISLDPKLGKLTPLREFLLRYDPSTKFLSGKDEFQIEIYEKDKVVKQLIVTINMREKAEDIPCGLHAIEDLLCVRPGIATSVLFAANDVICGSSADKLVKSIYLNPEHGIAELRGDTILYSPAQGYSGPDYLVYKLLIANEAGPPTESFGLISIPPPSDIRFEATALNVTEGKDANAHINFERSIACDDTVRIRVNGDAAYGSNYITDPPVQNGIIEIPIGKGKASAVVKVTTINNDKYEGNKIIAFRLISSGAALNPDTVAYLTFTVGDDEGPSLANFASNMGTVMENNSAGSIVVIPLSSMAKGTGSITISISPGTSIYGTRFRTVPEATNGVLTFDVAVSQAYLQFVVEPINDGLCLGDTNIVFTITGVSGVVKFGNSLTYALKLVDDELPQSVSFVQTGWSEPVCDDYGYCPDAVPISSGMMDEGRVSGIVAEILFSEPVTGAGTITVKWQNSATFCNVDIGYGNSFTTSPAPLTPETIVLPVSQGQTGTSFTIFPVNNDQYLGDVLVSFEIMSVSGSLQKGQLLTYQLRITDNEIPALASFAAPTNQTVGEDNLAGYLVEIPFSQPAQGAATISISTGSAYGTEFITQPARTGSFLILNVGPGESHASFKVLPIDNSNCGNAYLSFQMSSCGFVRVGNSSVMYLTILDDDGSIASFVQAEGAVNENSTEGITIQIGFSEPLVAPSFIYLRPSKSQNRIFAKPPVETLYDYYDESYVYYRWSLAQGATGTSITLFPVNNQAKEGNFLVDFLLSTSGCLTANPNLKYRLTVIDDD